MVSVRTARFLGATVLNILYFDIETDFNEGMFSAEQSIPFS